MVTYRGLPAPVICDFLSREASRAIYAAGTEFHIGKIEMVANTGTYVDSPFHRYADGTDLAGLPLESLADLEGVVVRGVLRPDLRELGDARVGADLGGRTRVSAHGGGIAGAGRVQRGSLPLPDPLQRLPQLR